MQKNPKLTQACQNKIVKTGQNKLWTRQYSKIVLLQIHLIKPYKMPLRHQRSKYKTQQVYKTSELMEQKNLAKPHQRQLILDFELACNKTEPSVCFHPAPLCVELYKNWTNLDGYRESNSDKL